MLMHKFFYCESILRNLMCRSLQVFFLHKSMSHSMQ